MEARRVAPLERGAGEGKLLFLDAASGLSGDMIVGGLVDLGVPREVIAQATESIALSGWSVRWVKEVRSGIVATRFCVEVEPGQAQRSWSDIRGLLEGADLRPAVRRLALCAFGKLAEAEAGVHGVPVDDVHFHEVGAVDSILDIVGAAAAFEHLGARVVSSPLPLGRGFVRCRHGRLPLPAPATVSCLRGIPTYDGGAEAELVTPTGACLVAACARAFTRWPTMRPEHIGWGAGVRELPDRPNLLRVVLGSPEVTVDGPPGGSPFVVLEANVDDMTGELAANAIDRALECGALDAWATPIDMKKGRPALMICALARRERADSVARVLLAETTSLGLRLRPAERIERPRRVERVDTPFGVIGVKVADGDGLPRNAAPEYEDCRRAAREHGVTLKEVYAAAIRATSRAPGDSL